MTETTGGTAGLTFTARISAAGRGGHAVRMPGDVREIFGEARPPVVVVADGQLEFRTRIVVYSGAGWIGLRKDQLAALGADVGDEITLNVRVDSEPRVVEPPGELLLALASDTQASEIFDGLSFTHRREYAQWVSDAKQSETRQRRAGKVLEMLKEGKRL